MSTPRKTHRAAITTTATKSKRQLEESRGNALHKVLHNGEYLLQRQLHGNEQEGTWLATQTYLSLPVTLKQLQTNESLPIAVMAELDTILYAGDSAYKPERTQTEREKTTEKATSEPLSPLALQFIREALLLARLKHPAIPALYDYFVEDDSWYLVTDSIPGQTLASYLHQYAPLPALEALHYAQQICDVLAYLHKQRPPMLYWQLTPDHLMLTLEGTIVLTDIHLTQALTTEKEASQISRTEEYGITSGEELYIAPELLATTTNNALPLNMQADLYSLGIILYEMLHGTLPVGATQPELAQIATSEPLISGVSRMLSSLVKLAIQPEPGDRFQSTRTFSLALERAYRIEEHRVHSEQIYEQSPVRTNDNDAAARPDPTPQKPTPTPDAKSANLTPYVTDPEQRRLTREKIHQSQVDRSLQEQLEHQLASFDESLTRRSTMSQSLHTLEVPRPTIQQRRREALHDSLSILERGRIRTFIQISFIVALLLFLILASLLMYTRIRNYFQDRAQRDQVSTSEMIGATAPQETDSSTSQPIPDSAWQKLAPLPVPVADNAAVQVTLQGKEYIYTNGGYRGHTESPRYDHSLYRYDIANARWETVVNEQFPAMVNNAAASDKDGNIFFSAGYSPDSMSVSSLLYSYQPEKAQLAKITPPADIHLGFGNAIFSDRQGHLYLTEGYLEAGKSAARAGNGWYRYDIANQHWQRLADLPIGLGYVTLASSGRDTTTGNGDSILLFGGSLDAGQQQQSNKIYHYDISTDSWSQESTSMPVALSAAAGCSIWPGQYILVGGYAAKTNLASTWLFDLQTLKAHALHTTPDGGAALGTATCDGHGHLYAIRGMQVAQHPTHDFWQLSIRPHLIIDNE